ncbi:ABC transporter ATP-binding protein [Paenibacillus sp. G2S3]|uniref:ABC transporter ATP-binding protein n=1 Tax=Paenibacillus sp. G2S3 TaxID=3047872 RepID=UPI0024C1FA13|nr:ABC transporter ATP-binding protein [Paenibacillus sp. G2S3]WHY19025.1 ABC transporter ATP-binding protein [Paenibacillus sp. G2S3]
MDLAIEVKKLSKVYRLYNKPVDRLREALSISKKTLHTDHFALQDISFTINKGESIGIIGKNGSGKSTLLKLITGVLTPTEGTVNANGKIAALLELGTGFNPEYTGIENIYLNSTMMGFSKEAIDDKVQDIVKFADIGEFINQPVKTYSSGMFARLAFSVAINVEPDILIVDEALSVGDIFFQSKCYKKFEEFSNKGKTLIFVSHDMGSVIKYCARSIVLHEGKLVAEGPSREMVDVYKKLLNNNIDDEIETTTIEEDTSEVLWSDKLINKNPNFIEYGNNEAKIFDFGVFDQKKTPISSVIGKESFFISMKVAFNTTVVDPIFAFTIKDIKGNEITGTNTMYEKINTGTAIEGDVYDISFEQNVPLQNGGYLISLGCTGYNNGEFQIYHRLYDVLHLNVISEKDTVGFFNIDSSVTLKKNNR